MKKTTISVLFWLAAIVAYATAHSQVPVRGTTVNATTGFQINGSAPNNYLLCGNGTVAIFQYSCGPAVNYQTMIDINNTSFPQRIASVFGAAFTLTDIPPGAGGGGTRVDLAGTIPVNITGRAAVATNADNATHAGSADSATNATHATNADNATNAINATNLVATGMGFPARAFGPTYTALPVRREVMITANCSCNVGHNSQLTAYVNGNKVGANSTQNGGGLISVTFVVPPNGTYSATFSEVGTSGGTLLLDTWTEWDN